MFMPGSPGRRDTAFLAKDAGSAPGLGGARPAEEVMPTMLPKLPPAQNVPLLLALTAAVRWIAVRRDRRQRCLRPRPWWFPAARQPAGQRVGLPERPGPAAAGRDGPAARLHQRLRDRDQRRLVPGRVQQRSRGRQLRRDLAGVPRPAHAVGRLVSTLRVPDASQPGGGLVTSFSSKSELALNLSTERPLRDVHGLRGQAGPARRVQLQHPRRHRPDQPGVQHLLPRGGHAGRPGPVLSYTETNAYSGNNGRAAILNDSRGANVLYTAGNAGNGGNPQPDGVILGAGAQIMTPSRQPETGPAAGPADPGRQLQRDPARATPPTRSARTPTSAA